MNRLYARCIGGAMTLATLAAILLIHVTIAHEPVQALACCQTCEANEVACYSACDSSTHSEEGDSVQACYDSCFYELYEGPRACFAHCTYCSPEPEGNCYLCYVTEHGFGYNGYIHEYYCQPDPSC